MNSTLKGPNTKCIDSGTCEKSICMNKSLCDNAFCSLYGPGCVFNGTSKSCKCSDVFGYVAAEDGSCVSTYHKNAPVDIYVYLVPIMVIILLILGGISLGLYLRHKRKYPKMPK